MFYKNEIKNYRSYYFVCTPGLSRVWIFYPLWLCIPYNLPEKIIIDYNEMMRYYKYAQSKYSTIFDILTWFILNNYYTYNFLICHNIKYEKPNFYKINPYSCPLIYNMIVTPNHINENYNMIKNIIKNLSKEESMELLLYTYNNWQLFGFELTKYYREKDEIFIKAWEIEKNNLQGILNNKEIFDPKKLIKRQLMKLLAGLRVREYFSKITNINLSKIKVFETPEYLPYVELLCKKLDIDRGAFGIPESSPLENENFIKDVLKIDNYNRPIFFSHYKLLIASINEIKELFNNGESEITIKYKIECDLKIIKNKIKKIYIEELFKKLESISTIPGIILFKPLISLALVLIKREEILYDELSSFPTYIKFIAINELINDYNQKFYKIWIPAFLRLAKIFRSKDDIYKESEDRLIKALTKPWVEKPIWYDPQNNI